MNASSVIFTFCVLLSVTYQGIRCSNEDNRSQELADGKNQTDSSEGPPDSHEAMNNREMKPTLTIGDRRKRSYEFLMGLVKRNNSNYEVTSEERNMPQHVPTTEAAAAGASEVLLELMIKIAENPEQWRKVHQLLQKIDTDLLKSKELIESIKINTASMDTTTVRTPADDRNKKNVTAQWSVDKQTTKYPWQLSTKPGKTYQKNFAYHRVTGNPLTHNKNPKAYIAVSVVAPKPMQARTDEEELALENELKELKPWTHQQNLRNMERMRSRWVIQSNEKKELYAP